MKKLTKELKDYKKMIEADTLTIEKPDVELVKAWLDAKIEYMVELDRLARIYDFDLCWGEYDKAKPYSYDVEIGVCSSNRMYTKEIHVNRGVELLADILGEKLSCTRRKDDEYPYGYSFMYKGYRIFQISKEEI